MINITGGPDLALHDVSDATQTIYDAAGEDAEVIFGVVIDQNLSEEMRVTVIATGFSRPAGSTASIGSLPTTRLTQTTPAYSRATDLPRAVMHEFRTPTATLKPQDTPVRKLTREVNGRPETVVKAAGRSGDFFSAGSTTSRSHWSRLTAEPFAALFICSLL